MKTGTEVAMMERARQRHWNLNYVVWACRSRGGNYVEFFNQHDSTPLFRPQDQHFHRRVPMPSRLTSIRVRFSSILSSVNHMYFVNHTCSHLLVAASTFIPVSRTVSMALFNAIDHASWADSDRDAAACSICTKTPVASRAFEP